jgi:hypothetical protein
MRAQYNREHLLSVGLASRLRRAQRFKPITLIVHTRRDLWQMNSRTACGMYTTIPCRFYLPTKWRTFGALHPGRNFRCSIMSRPEAS